jgi:hypothetical protein
MGSYDVFVTNNGNGTATYDLLNNMGLHSLAGHLAKDRPTRTPFGSSQVHLQWTESSPCR